MTNNKAYSLFALDVVCYLGAIAGLFYFGLTLAAIAVAVVFVVYLYFAVPRLQKILAFNGTLDVNDLSQNSREL
jgi:hypothetical protein